MTNEDERTARTSSTNTITIKATIPTLTKTSDVVIVVSVVPLPGEQHQEHQSFYLFDVFSNLFFFG